MEAAKYAAGVSIASFMKKKVGRPKIIPAESIPIAPVITEKAKKAISIDINQKLLKKVFVEALNEKRQSDPKKLDNYRID